MATLYKVSACIVTYRSPLARLKEAVESLNRTSIPLHLTVMDNHSGAGYTAQLAAIKGCSVVHSGANKGFGFGHNLGLREAPASDYHLVANPDVVVHQGCLEAMVNYMDANPDVVLLAPKVLNPDGSLQPLNKRLPGVFDLFARRFLPAKLRAMPAVAQRMAAYEMRDVGYDAIAEVPFISGCFMLFRRRVLEQLNGFDEGYFMYLEDCDITRRASAYGRCLYFPHATITHVWARGSHRSLRLMVVMIRSMIHYFRVWGWKW